MNTEWAAIKFCGTPPGIRRTPKSAAKAVVLHPHRGFSRYNLFQNHHMKTYFNHLTFVLLFVAFAVGCGKNATVTGTVTFPDGTPLDRGVVIFENDKIAARGDIRKDGTYSLTSGEDKGIPPGTYRVSISGANQPIIEPPTAEGGGAPKITLVTNPIDRKYESPSTSGLTREVTGRTTFDIIVDPPQ